MRPQGALVVFILVAACCCPVSVSAENQLIVVDFDSLSLRLETEHQADLDVFRADNASKAGKLRYLIVPHALLNGAGNPAQSNQSWGIYASRLDGISERLSLFPIGMRSKFRDAVAKAIDAKPFESNGTEDVVILDEKDQQDLIRLIWLNRFPADHEAGLCQGGQQKVEGEDTATGSSFPESREVAAIRRFDCEFLSDSRKWFLGSKSSGRLLIVAGLRTSEVASVFAYIPDHPGPYPLFEVYSGERVLLAEIVRLLRAESVPALIVFKPTIVESNVDLSEDAMTRLASRINIEFVRGKSRISGKFDTWEPRQGEMLLAGHFQRNVLSAESIRMTSMDPSLRFLNCEEGQLSAEWVQRFPEYGTLLYEGTPMFTPAAVEVNLTRNFQALGAWRYRLSLGASQFELLPGKLPGERKVGSKEPVEDFMDILISDLKSDIARESRGARRFVSDVQSTAPVLHSLADYYWVAQQLTQDDLSIVLAVNTAGSATSVATRGRVRRHSEFVRLFLQFISGKSIEVMEKMDSDSGTIGKLDVIFIPNRTACSSIGKNKNTAPTAANPPTSPAPPSTHPGTSR